jgi:hypothetical protein
MADGSAISVIGRVFMSYEDDCPTLPALTEGQVVVGCCNRCGATAEVDISGWKVSTRDWDQKLCVIQGQTACVSCLCRYIALQVWPAPPYPDRRKLFRRWR